MIGSMYVMNVCFCRTLSFKIKIGGGSGCETADIDEDVVVEYQPLGSTSFIEIKKMAYNGNDSPACLRVCHVKNFL